LRLLVFQDLPPQGPPFSGGVIGVLNHGNSQRASKKPEPGGIKSEQNGESGWTNLIVSPSMQTSWEGVPVSEA
jgi:hypothetical protein